MMNNLNRWIKKKLFLKILLINNWTHTNKILIKNKRIKYNKILSKYHEIN